MSASQDRVKEWKEAYEFGVAQGSCLAGVSTALSTYMMTSLGQTSFKAALHPPTSPLLRSVTVGLTVGGLSFFALKRINHDLINELKESRITPA